METQGWYHISHLNKNLLTAALKVPTSLEEWPEQEGIRRASINNFGYGGSNAHVIMEGLDSFVASSCTSSSPHGFNTLQPRAAMNGNGNGALNGHSGNAIDHANGHSRRDSDASSVVDSIRSRVFILSAKDERAAKAMADNLKEHLLTLNTADENAYLDDLAYTLGHRRSVLPWTSTFAGNSIASLVKTLDSGKVEPTKRGAPQAPRLGFVYTGQGAQWWAMGRELIDVYPVFKATLLDCDVHLKRLGAKWNMIGKICFWHLLVMHFS